MELSVNVNRVCFVFRTNILLAHTYDGSDGRIARTVRARLRRHVLGEVLTSSSC